MKLLTILTLFIAINASAAYEKPLAIWQVKNMPIKSGAGATVNPFYSYNDNGYVADTANFPTTGSYRFDVSGYSWFSGGQYSNCQVRIDGVSVGNFAVASLIPTVGMFSLYVPSITSGRHQVALALTNTGGGITLKMYLGLVYITKTALARPAPEPTTAKVTLQAGQIINSRHFNSGVLRGLMVGGGVLSGASTVGATDFRATGANIARWFINVDHTTSTAYQLRAGDLTKLDTMIERAQRYGYYMTVTLGMHPNATSEDYLADVSARNMDDSFVQRRASITSILKSLAIRYKNKYGVSGYDLINEPRNSSNYADWINFASQLIDTIRATGDNHAIIVETSTGSNMFAMMIPMPYANVVYSTHLYTPLQITHQGIIDTDTLNYPRGATGVYGAFDKQDIAASLDNMDTLVRRYNLPVFIGELSCIGWAPNNSADRWMGNAMEACEARGYSWCYHAFREFEGWDPEIPRSYWYGYSYTLAAPNYPSGTDAITHRTSATPAMDTLRRYFGLNGVALIHNKYYFSSSGSDGATSLEAQSSSTPWASISKLNSFFPNLQPGDSVFFKRGETFYGTITPTKSGDINNRIFIGAYGSGAKPVITGLQTLSSFTNLGAGRYSAVDANLTTRALPNSLNIVLLNDSLAKYGRYPNSGYLTATSFIGATSLTGPALPFNPTGAELALRSERWVIDRCVINTYSAGTINYTSYAGRNPNITHTNGYFIQGSTDTTVINQYSEWAYTPSLRKLTINIGSDVVGSDKIQAAAIDTGINVKASFITIDNLNIYGFNKFGVGINGNSYVTIQNSDIKFIGIHGVENGAEVDNLKIINNNFYQCLSMGIRVGSLPGQPQYGCSNLYIGYNTLNKSGHTAGTGQSDSEPYKGIRVKTSDGVNNMIEYNFVKNSGYVGIGMAGSNLTVQKNFIDSATYIKDDAAGIYVVPSGAGGTVGSTHSNRKILYNIITNVPSAMEGTPAGSFPKGGLIYLDDNANHVQIIGNSGYNAFWGFYCHTCRNVRLQGNTFFRNDKSLYMQRDELTSPLNYDTVWNNIFAITKNTGATENTYLGNSALTLGYEETQGADSIRFLKQIDSNRHVAPINTAGIGYIKINVNSGSNNYNFANWKTTYAPYDAHGNASPVTWASNINVLDSTIFLFNASQSPATFSLAGKTYKDARGITYNTGSVTLAPYASFFGLRSGAAAVPNTNPTVNITTPTSGTTYTATATINICATATDADGTISQIDYYNGNTLIGTVSSGCFSWTGVQPGTYALTAKAIDNLGGTGTSSVKTVIVNAPPANQPPTVSITAPSNGATYTDPATVNITATASDDVSVSSVSFYNGSTLLFTDVSAPYSYSWTGVVAGGYILTAKATDGAGLVTTSAPISITVSSVINIPPVINISLDSATYNEPARIIINATATDDGSISIVNYYADGVLIGSNSTAPYGFVWSPVAAGSYVITAVAIDNLGNTTTSNPVTIVVRAKYVDYFKIRLYNRKLKVN